MLRVIHQALKPVLHVTVGSGSIPMGEESERAAVSSKNRRALLETGVLF
jgi:hypothetical protein